jgi:hypothetical protein
MRRLRSRARWVVAAAVVAALAACGSPPSFRYVASTDRSVVLKVPSSWAEVDPASLGFTNTSDTWRAYYDGSGRPNPADFMSGDVPLTSPAAPVVKVATLKIPTGSKVTEQDLADLLLPTSQTELVKMARQSWLNGVTLQAYGTLEKTPVKTATSTGIRMVSGYNFGGPNIIVEKVAVTDTSASHIHVIQVWCAEQCFVQNRAQIDSILSTFTVKQL